MAAGAQLGLIGYFIDSFITRVIAFYAFSHSPTARCHGAANDLLAVHYSLLGIPYEQVKGSLERASRAVQMRHQVFGEKS